MKRILETMKIKDYWYMVCSFLFTLVIPIIFLISYQYTAYDLSKNLVEQSNKKIIDNATLSIDTNVNNISLTFDKLVFEPEIYSFFNNKTNYKGSSDLYIVKNAKRTLDKYSHYFDKEFVSDILVFNPSNGIALSKELDYADLCTFYNSVYQYGNYQYSQFISILDKVPPRGQFLSNQKVTIKDKNEDVISYVRPMFDESNQRMGYLIAHISTNSLTREFAALNYGDTGYFTISDIDEKTLFSTHNSIDEYKNNQDEFYVTKCVNLNSAFSYELGLPKTYISETIKPLRDIPKVYILISIFLGIALSVLLSYLRIKPISELFSLFEPEQEHYQFNSLSAGLHKIIEENSAIKVKLSEQFVLAKYELINKVFNGDFEEDEIDKISQTLKCPVSDCYYVVLDITDKTNNKSSNLFLPATETAIISAGFTNHFMQPYKGKSLSCFICLEDNDLDKFSSMLTSVKHILQSVGGFNASIYAGSIVISMQGISQSKKEADFLFVNIEKSGIYIHDLMLDTINFHYPIKTETRLIKAITEGKSKKVGDTLDHLFESNLNDKEINLTLYKRFVEGIINTFFRIDSTLFVTYKNKINAIERVNSIKRSCIELRQLAFSLTEKFINKNENCEFTLQEEVMDYVKNHYCESTFTILELADKFNKSYDCMYNYFKKTYKKTFSAFLEQMRIEKSMELLKTGENIDTIAKLCGYNSSHSFRRTFNKRNGVTPSVYRDQVTK